jgi:hypothetical protein
VSGLILPQRPSFEIPTNAGSSHLRALIGDPGRMAELKRMVEAEKTRRSLLEFAKYAWKWIEPGEMSLNWHIECLADHLVAVSNRQIKRLLINLPPRHMKPVDINARVDTARGYVHLGDIVVGDLVLTHLGRYRKVLAILEQGDLPVLRISTEQCRVVLATPDHRFLTGRGWLRADHIVRSDNLYAALESCVIAPDRVADVEDGGIAECRCLTVEEDESFTANDLVVHNSALAGVIWPAWTWAQKPPKTAAGYSPLIPDTWLGPGVKFTFLAYAGELSTRDSVKCRQLIDSPWYQSLFGDTVSFSPDQNTKTRYTNTLNGSRLALSFEGRITGEGADILCLPSWVEVLTETGAIPIGEIVNKKMDVRVWSYNHETEEAELQPLLDHEIHPSRELVEITTSDGNVLTCTIDHPIYVVGKGYIPAGDVCEDDEVIVAD